VPGEVAVPGQRVTLRWTHSIERVRWEETYHIVPAGGSAGRCPPAPQAALCPVQARVRGSGAGMEPAPSAVWRNGGFEWAPDPVLVPALRLMHSTYTADYTVCVDGRCQPLTTWLGLPNAAAADGVVRLRACRGP